MTETEKLMVQKALDIVMETGKTLHEEVAMAHVEAILRDTLGQKHGVWDWRVKRANDAYTAASPTKGTWFHSTKDGVIANQGQVVSVSGDGSFKVQLYSFVDGSRTDLKTVTADYFIFARFYETDEEMRAAYSNYKKGD
jgi:hypothetical protein